MDLDSFFVDCLADDGAENFCVLDAVGRNRVQVFGQDDVVGQLAGGDRAVPSLFTTYAYCNSDKFEFHGEELMKRCMAFRTLLDTGIHAAAGSGFSHGHCDSRMAIQGNGRPHGLAR